VARLNIETKVSSDPRFQKLLIKVGDRHKAKGVLWDLWELAQQYWFPEKLPIPESSWKDADLPEALIECGFAERVSGGYYARGSEEQFDWIFRLQDAGKASAESKKQKKRKRQDQQQSTAVEQPLTAVQQPSTAANGGQPLISYLLSPSSLLISPDSFHFEKAEEKSATPTAQIRKSFLDAYRKEFGKDYPGWGAKENSQAANWIRSISLEKALEYCAFYPKWNDPWVTNNGHAFGILVSQYVKLDAWLSRPDQIIAKIAEGKAHERVRIGQAQSLAEVKQYARQQQQQGTRGDPRLPEPSKANLSLGTANSIHRELGASFSDQESFAPPSEVDHATGS
jgi:ribosomal protein L13E